MAGITADSEMSRFFNSKGPWISAAVVALYLYFLLPGTAVLFYELYHLLGFEPIYWG